MFSSGKAFYGPYVYDITNSGAVGVTAALSTGFSFKYNISSGYSSQKGSSGYLNSGSRKGIYVSGTSIVSVSAATGNGRFQCDPSTSTLNLQKSGGTAGGSTSPTITLLMDVNTGLSLSATTTAVSAYILNVATPISA
jgi:hypothetical protein